MEKNDINYTEMLAMQRELWEKHKATWSPLEPRYARNSLLWMFGEIGEVIELIKKQEEERITSIPELRAHFVEELCDVQMYFNDVLMRYNITPAEIAEAYRAKHARNMGRDYEAQRRKIEEEIVGSGGDVGT